MFDHIGIAVSDLARSQAFYAAALAPLGIQEVMSFGTHVGYGREQPQFWLMQGTPGRSSPRTHVAFAARDRLEVDTFHRAALEHGGTDNGPPGLRPDYHPDYYGAFVLDPDGNNIEAVCHRPA